MSKLGKISGGCLCGAVRYTAEPSQNTYSVCHCAMCQKMSGAGFMSINCGSSVQVEDESTLTTFDSSDWAERKFCNQCGTPLFYHLKGANSTSVSVGTLDNSVGFEFDLQYFVDHKLAHFAYANKTKTMTSAEIYQAYPGLASGDQNG